VIDRNVAGTKGAGLLHTVLTAPPRLSYMHLADALVMNFAVRLINRFMHGQSLGSHSGSRVEGQFKVTGSHVGLSLRFKEVVIFGKR